MNFKYLPSEIITVIANYHGGLISNERLNCGWRTIHDDLLLYTYDIVRWKQTKRILKTVRWRYSGFNIYTNPRHPRVWIINDKKDNCICGKYTSKIPKKCTLSNCRCGLPNVIKTSDYTCDNCGRNPKQLWTWNNIKLYPNSRMLPIIRESNIRESNIRESNIRESN